MKSCAASSRAPLGGRRPQRRGAASLLSVAVALAACETTGGGFAGGASYDEGLYDSWYYGSVDWDDDDIALPPDARPERPPRPTHPIAKPPTARPMPSIPSRPRPARRR